MVIDSKNRSHRIYLILVVVGLIFIGLLAGSVITAKTNWLGINGKGGVPIYISANTDSQIAPLGSTVAPIAKRVTPAVVNIATESVIRREDSRRQFPFFDDPFFREFFGDRFQFGPPREQRLQSLGSGVIVSPDGYILTNNHVVENATTITVSMNDGREAKARVVGTDPRTDLAVIRIDLSNLPTLPFGNSDNLEVGDFVLAVGNPFGIGQTVTMGIVSALGRSRLGIIEGNQGYENFIQTDAAINRGNSGGALVNMRGELVGINTAILSSTGGFQGVGLAIPVNMARWAMDQIVRQGRVIRGWIGVSIQPVTQAIAQQFGLGEPRGAIVTDVSPGSPAAAAGLKTYDIIIEFNGRRIEDSTQLRNLVAATAPGTTATLKVWRDGKEQQVSVKLGELKDDQAAARGSGGDSREIPAGLEGIRVDNLTPDIARRLEISPATRGVVVTNVEQGSRAAESGLRPGDVIQEVNRQPVSNVDEFNRAVRGAGNRAILLLVNRRGQTFLVGIEAK